MREDRYPSDTSSIQLQIDTLYEVHSIRCINGKHRAIDRSDDKCRRVNISDYDEEYQLSCRAKGTRWQTKESGKKHGLAGLLWKVELVWCLAKQGRGLQFSTMVGLCNVEIPLARSPLT